MTQRKPISLYKVLRRGKNPSIAHLLAHAARLRKIRTIVENQLPPPLKTYCQVANYRENTLIIHAESAAWANKLRYLAPALLDNLNSFQELKDLKTITVKTRPANESIPRDARRASLSITAAGMIENLANCVTDSQLANALRRVAKHAYDKAK